MSQSMYLTIYLRHKFDEKTFSEDMQKARLIFKEAWIKLGTGFDEKGNIKGLSKLYESFGWYEDAKELEAENGELKILKMQIPDIAENISFNFHHYGSDLNFDKKYELRDIYLLFAEILSALGYVVKVSDEYGELKYSCFFDEDGNKYQAIENSARAEYFREILELAEAKDNFEKAKRRLKDIETKSEEGKARHSSQA